jgi:hypothetical protein
MHRISAGLATCLVAAVTVGCGTVQAAQPGSATHTAAPATAGTTSGQPGAPTAGGASARTPSGCRGAGPAVKTLVITLAGNGKTFCVRAGGKLSVYLRSADSHLWLRPLASSSALVPKPNPAGTLARGVTGASFAAARPGQALVTSVRPPCQTTIPAKGELEPAFPLPGTYPLRFCAPGHRFSASIIVVR